MKKVWISVLLLLSMFLMAGCKDVETAKPGNLPEELIDKEWFFYDEVICENLVLRFGSDGSYSYHCQCGEPVGNSDIYEKYDYDSANGVITLSNSYDDSTSEIEVIHYNEWHLVIVIDGELKEFVLEEMDNSTDFFWMEGESYLSGYNFQGSIIDVNENEITYGPIGYDPQGMYVDGPFETYELAEGAKLSELIITTWIFVEDGQECGESYETEYKEITLEDIKVMMEYGSGSAYIWFNEEMKIEKMLFWGQTIIME